MKWTCAALVALSGFAWAQGDDDLGLPQIDLGAQLNVPPPAPESPAGFFKHDGVLYGLIDNRAVPLEREFSMRITPRKIIGFNGRAVQLPPGMMFTLNGQIVPLPVAPEQPAATASNGPATNATTTVTANSSTEGAPTLVVGVPGRPLIPNVGTTAAGVSVAEPGLGYLVEPNPPASPATQITAQPHMAPATVPPPQPAFASPSRPDRTGPRTDVERPVDRTRPESVPDRRDDPTRVSADQQPMDRTRPSGDRRFWDRTYAGPDDYRFRDRTMPGPDDERPPDPTRRRDR